MKWIVLVGMLFSGIAMADRCVGNAAECFKSAADPKSHVTDEMCKKQLDGCVTVVTGITANKNKKWFVVMILLQNGGTTVREVLPESYPTLTKCARHSAVYDATYDILVPGSHAHCEFL